MARNSMRNETPGIEREVRSGSIDSILAVMFRKMMSELGISQQKFNMLMEKYLGDPRNNIPQNMKDRATERGNMRRELMRTTMTWKVLCKGIRFLNVWKFSITFRLHHANKVVTEHSMTINLGEHIENDTEEETNTQENENGKL